MAELDNNLFILLDLDPDQPWNQAEFERRLQEKRREWSRNMNSPKLAVAAKKNMGRIPELQQIAGDEALRQAAAAEARQTKSAAQGERVKEFAELLNLLQGKGHILEEELQRLVKEFAGVLSEKEIRQRIKVPLKKETLGGPAKRAELEPAKAKDIANKLRGINKKDLYDFLELSPNVEEHLLLRRAKELYDSVQRRAVKSADDTLTSELAGYCLDIFKTKTEREKYNETLRLQQFDELKQRADTIVKLSQQIDATQMDNLLRGAAASGLNPDEAFAILQEHIRQKRYAATYPDGLLKQVQSLQRCGQCYALNQPTDKHCTRCSQPLREPCPRCNQVVASDSMACGSCGFPVGNRAYLLLLLNEAEQAYRERNQTAAASGLQQAKTTWPATGQDSLSKKVAELDSKITPALREQETAVRAIETAIQQNRFYEAQTLLPGLERLLPSGSERLGDYRRQTAAKIQQVEARLGQARRLSDNPEEAVRFYQEALRIVADCREAREMLARTPPAPPANLRAAVGDRVVHLSWNASPAQGIQYSVIRKRHSRPAAATDGEKLATVAGLLYDDDAAEVGVPLYYAVFADREGTPSTNAAAISTPVMLLQEAQRLAAQIDDQKVHLTWEAPPNVHDIMALRSESRYPTSTQEGQRIAILDKSQAVDIDVVNGRRYFYTIFCRFKEANGGLRTTQGVHIEAVPQLPPKPIKTVALTADGPVHARKLRLEWSAPEKGNAVILQADKPTGLELGTVISQTELASYGRLLSPNGNQLIYEISRAGFYYFLPAVLFQGTAYVGQEQRYICVDDVSNLSVQNLGHALRLQWQWPPDCWEVLVAYSQQQWPQAGRPDTVTAPLTRAQYDLRGHYDIANPVQADYYIAVLAIVSQDGQQVISAGETESARKLVTLRSRITLNYEITKSWWGKKFSLQLTVKGKGQLPALVLVSKQGALPMNRSDGQLVLRVEPTAIEREQIAIALPENSEWRQGYGRLFLEDDALYDMVTIRHPDREKLRLF
jgi:hypothetical protein